MELPRGMKDFDGVESAGIEHVRSRFKGVSDLYGFAFMEPSVLESLLTLETKSGPSIREEIYYFKDKGEREVALRFDFTMGLTRYVTSQKSMRLPAKISAFGGVFRYDEPQKGRYRYFHQWDIEVYGRPSLESDAEIIEITSRLFDSLMLKDIVIYVNHRNLVEKYITRVFGFSDPQKLADIMRAIDKTQKRPADEILTEFSQKGYKAEHLKKILAFSQIRGTVCEVEELFDTSQLESWDAIKLLFDSLENRGVLNAQISFGIVRGLDYYSGMVFEVFDKNSELGALAGGGRYDTLTKAFGRDDLGAAGVAGGVERIILTMQEQKIAPQTKQGRVAVLYTGSETQRVALSVASLLRASGIPTDIDLAGRSMQKQMRAAAKSRLAVIVGPRELEQGNVILRDMQDGAERAADLEKLKDNPKSVLSSGMPL